MKRILLSLVIATISIPLSGQISSQMNAFGFRAGYNDGFAGELNYQRYLNESRHLRLETGFAFRDVSKEPKYLKLVSTIQYITPLVGNYKLYIGLGGGFGNYETDALSENEFIATGVIGIEWSNILPLIFSLDVRPEYRPNSVFNDDLYFDVGLSVRFQF